MRAARASRQRRSASRRSPAPPGATPASGRADPVDDVACERVPGATRGWSKSSAGVAAHAEPLHQPPRALVPGRGVGDDLVEPERPEAEVDRRLRPPRGRCPSAPVLAPEPPADLDGGREAACRPGPARARRTRRARRRRGARRPRSRIRRARSRPPGARAAAPPRRARASPGSAPSPPGRRSSPRAASRSAARPAAQQQALRLEPRPARPGPLSGTCRSAVQADGKRLQLVDEGRFDVARARRRSRSCG